MQKIKELQQKLQNLILQPSLKQISVEDLNWMAEPAAAAESFQMNRLEIYHYAYQARIVESLEDDFPSVKNLLGENQWQIFCAEFVYQQKKMTHDLQFLSFEFLNFLIKKMTTKGAEQNVEMTNATQICEIARLEWKAILTFLSFEPRQLGVEQMSLFTTAPLEKIAWSWNQTLQTHQSPFLFSQVGKTTGEFECQNWQLDKNATKNEFTDCNNQESHYYFFYRKNDSVCTEILDQLLGAVILEMMSADTVGAAIESALQKNLSMELIQSALQKACAEQWIVNLSIAE